MRFAAGKEYEINRTKSTRPEIQPIVPYSVGYTHTSQYIFKVCLTPKYNSFVIKQTILSLNCRGVHLVK